MKSTAIILLAAGPSSRMGRPKQSLMINDQTLLGRSCEVALQTGLPVTVVLGAFKDEHRKLIAHLPVNVAINDEWTKGMGSSLKAGLKHLLDRMNNVDSAIVMVCDQLLLKTDHLLALKSLYDATANPIVASQYANIAGVPALFDKNLFPELLNASDRYGAREIIKNHPHETTTVNFPEGIIDLDTDEDVRQHLQP